VLVYVWEKEGLTPVFKLKLISKLIGLLGPRVCWLWEHLTTTKEEKNTFDSLRLKQKNEEKTNGGVGEGSQWKTGIRIRRTGIETGRKTLTGLLGGSVVAEEIQEAGCVIVLLCGLYTDGHEERQT